MGFYNIDFDRFVWQLLPVRRRKAAMFAWLRSLIAPCRDLYTRFLGKRAADLYYVSHNGQVASLEAVLNDWFDNDLRRITITNPVYADPLYLYRKEERKPVSLGKASESAQPYGNKHLWLRSELFTLDSVLFNVNVPNAVTLMAGYDERKLIALIYKYRVAGKRNYQINIS